MTLDPPAGPGDWLALVAIASVRPDVVPPRLRAVLQDALDRARAEHETQQPKPEETEHA